MRLKHTVACALLACVLFLARQTHSATAQSAPASQVLALVNQVRAEHGLPPYRFNATLAIAAQNHANWMAANVIYSHTGAGGTSPQDRARAAGYNGYVSENIVGGWHMTPEQGVIWWRNSDIHYRMMVSQRYVEAGVAYATNGVQNMYVLVMGLPSNQPPPANAPPEPQSEPIAVIPIDLAQPGEDGSIVHTVGAGQALWQIAAHYGVHVTDLYLYNGLDEDSFIQPGDKITVRLADDATPPPTPTPPLSHVVTEGDNVWIIAVRYNVDRETIFYLNGLDETTVLQPGDEVRVRLADGETPPPTPTPKLSHVVTTGDTLLSVAGSYNLTLEELLAYNPGITADTMLFVGNELAIRPSPTPAATATPTAVPTGTATPAGPEGPASAVIGLIEQSPTPTVAPTFPPAPPPQLSETANAVGAAASTTLAAEETAPPLHIWLAGLVTVAMAALTLTWFIRRDAI